MKRIVIFVCIFGVLQSVIPGVQKMEVAEELTPK